MEELTRVTARFGSHAIRIGPAEQAAKLLDRGRVQVLGVEPGHATLEVDATRSTRHLVEIEVDRLTRVAFRELAKAIAASSRSTAALFEGRLDESALAFGHEGLGRSIDLVPGRHEVRTTCSCGRREWNGWCEHRIAALVRLVYPLDDLRLVIVRGGDPVQLERLVRALRRRPDPGIGANRSWVRARASTGVAYPEVTTVS